MTKMYLMLIAKPFFTPTPKPIGAVFIWSSPFLQPNCELCDCSCEWFCYKVKKKAISVAMSFYLIGKHFTYIFLSSTMYVLIRPRGVGNVSFLTVNVLLGSGVGTGLHGVEKFASRCSIVNCSLNPCFSTVNVLPAHTAVKKMFSFSNGVATASVGVFNGDGLIGRINKIVKHLK